MVARRSIFVQVVHWKWYSYCYAGRITAEAKLAGVIDLQKQAEEFAYRFLAGKKDAAFSKHQREFETTVESFPWSGESKDLLKADNDGVIALRLSGIIPHAQAEEDSDFEVIERIKLTEKTGVELMDIRYAH